MEVENSLFRYQGNPLTHLTVEDHEHHVVYPSKYTWSPPLSSSLEVVCCFSVIPATSSSTGETTPPQREDSDSVPGGDDTEDTAPRRPHAEEDRQDLVSRCAIAPLPVEVLERNRLSAAEIRAVPRFTNYAQGEPSKVGSRSTYSDAMKP